MYLRELFIRVLEHIRKHKYIYSFCVLAFLAVLILMSCQGLANANGDANTIVIHKMGGLI